jgi:hypothetical protein
MVLSIPGDVANGRPSDCRAGGVGGSGGGGAGRGGARAGGGGCPPWGPPPPYKPELRGYAALTAGSGRAGSSPSARARVTVSSSLVNKTGLIRQQYTSRRAN